MISNITIEKDQLKESVENLSQAVNQFKQEIFSKDQQITQLSAQNIEYSDIAKEVGQNNEVIIKLQGELTEATNSMQNLSTKLQETEQDLSQKTSENIDLTSQVNKMRDEVANAHIAAQNNKELQEIKIQLQNITTEKDNFQTKIKELTDSLSRVEKEKYELNKLYTELKIKFQKLHENFMSSQDTKVSVEEFEKLQKDFNDKKAECLTVESDLQMLKDNHKNADMLMELQKQEIAELKTALREFTSFRHEDFDDTYEAVLKSEFERMKNAFQARIDKMQIEMVMLIKICFKFKFTNIIIYRNSIAKSPLVLFLKRQKQLIP